ncbi:MAG TPA: tRNA 2-thiouridine(34) synthase MnmA [Sedimentisphaerales bacterium]|nr:tRNA 2-thiouridine(34) synthase MnmA [Sedimentisphaerales bacterium]
MVAERKKVFVALSGGVDSSTAAALLNQNGFNCAGVFMITCDESHDAQADTEQLCEKLGIKLYVLDLRRDFERILDYFCSEYRKARTPNPCVLCNRYIKFGKLWDFARSNGAGLLATGHYARILEHNNHIGLYESLNAAKDQSYVLSMVNKEILPYLILPMGNYSKNQTRQMAAKFGLGTEHKVESQEICFVPDDDYVALLEQRCPELVRKGNIVDSSGKVLGEHNGMHRFTIGQRRGLRVAMGKPYYVVKIDAESNTVTLGPKEEVMHIRLWATGVNWLSEEPASSFRAKVKIRYNDRGAPARVSPQGNSVAVEFDEPNLAITPGQLAAFYVQEGKNSRLIGGGWIDKVAD